MPVEMEVLSDDSGDNVQLLRAVKKNPNFTSVYGLFVTFACAISGFLFGYDQGIIDTVLKMESFQLNFGTATLAPSSNSPQNQTLVPSSDAADVNGNIVFTFLIGCIGGAVLSAFIVDSLGRTRSILVGTIFFTVGGVIQATCSSRPPFYLSRVASGLGIGVLSNVSPLYISEVSPTALRGRMVAVQQLMIVLGIFVASCVNAGMYTFVRGDSQWRGALAAQCVPGVILLCLLFKLPHSPRWLMMKNRDAEAEVVVKRLLGSDSQEERRSGAGFAAAHAEIQLIRESLNAERLAGTVSWRQLFQERDIFRQTRMVILLAVFQQLSGINVIMYYAADLFERMGVAASTASTSLVILNALVLVLATLPGLWLVERWGRRRLLVVGGWSMCACHLAVCIFVTLSQRVPSLSWAAVVSMMSFTAAFSASWGPVVWVIQSEVFPLRARAKGTSTGTLSNWTACAIIGKIAPLLVESYHQWVYLGLGICCSVMALYSQSMVPETQGVPLERMASLFQGNLEGAKSQVEESNEQQVADE
jgi:sugar porter (SP) family MFS transporter